MQTNSVYKWQHVYFVTSSDSGLIWPSAVTNMSVRYITNLWLWNCVPNPWILSRHNGFILLRNIVHSLKFELISPKIGLVFFGVGTWYTWTFSLPSTCCNYHDEKLCHVSKVDCIARDYILLAKLTEALGGFWRFLKLHMYNQLKNFYVCNHISQKAKGEISNWDAIANHETAVQVQAMFPAKKHPDCRHRWPEIHLW